MFDFGKGYRTQILGGVGIITGIATMITSDGDQTQMQAGWMQIFMGLVACFLRASIKDNKTTVDQLHNKIEQQQGLIQNLHEKIDGENDK